MSPLSPRTYDAVFVVVLIIAPQNGSFLCQDKAFLFDH